MPCSYSCFLTKARHLQTACLTADTPWIHDWTVCKQCQGYYNKQQHLAFIGRHLCARDYLEYVMQIISLVSLLP